ncbi:DNA mismatch repair protein, variant 2 [Homalodisca vitripennis]|nr:DNA mismatch repair protein, variant 2 [Homalodisca vitripennis]
MTNKCHSLNDLKTNIEYYGFRGEALASLRESCKVLVVISKHRGCDKTYSKVFRADKEIHSASVAVHNRMCNGTTVIVQDFLYNFPVRRARIQSAIELENIRHALLALSIINHQIDKIFRIEGFSNSLPSFYCTDIIRRKSGYYFSQDFLEDKEAEGLSPSDLDLQKLLTLRKPHPLQHFFKQTRSTDNVIPLLKYNISTFNK